MLHWEKNSDWGCQVLHTDTLKEKVTTTHHFISYQTLSHCFNQLLRRYLDTPKTYLKHVFQLVFGCLVITTSLLTTDLLVNVPIRPLLQDRDEEGSWFGGAALRTALPTCPPSPVLGPRP